MKKIEFTYLTIIISVLISVNPAKSQWDGGGFNAEYHDQGGYFEEYSGQDSLGQESGFYTGDGVYQQEGYEYGEGLNEEEMGFDQTNSFNPSYDFELDRDSVQSAESVQNKETASESLQDNLNTISNESNAVDPSQLHGVNQDISSAQSNHTQNDIQSSQNVENGLIANHDHNNGDHDHEPYDHGRHHYHDESSLGVELGLGIGLGFGSTFSPFFHDPFAPGGFGYYGFGYPFSSFGIGFYNNYAFGSYRRFESSYPLGSYLVTTPVFTAPLIPASLIRPTYIQQSEIHPAKPATVQRNDYWNYCRNPEGYYPYIKQCLEEWIKVPP